MTSILASQARFCVLNALSLGGPPYQIRELAYACKLRPRAVQVALKDLVAVRLVICVQSKQTRTYAANSNQPLWKYLCRIFDVANDAFKEMQTLKLAREAPERFKFIDETVTWLRQAKKL